MGLMDELRQLGVNVDEAVARMMGNEAVYQRILGKFPAMLESTALSTDFDASDCKPVIEKAHSLKGTTGNLSLTPLYEAYTKITNLLREGETESARELLMEIQPVQEKIVACIKKYSSVS